MLVSCLGNLHATNHSQLRSILASASVQSSPSPEITLQWPARNDIDSYQILVTATDGSSRVETVAGTSTGYSDTQVDLGKVYDYHIRADRTGSQDAYGTVRAGIDLPLIEDRGIIVLVVDTSHASGLASRLTRLSHDLIGDGWRVQRLDVSPDVPAVTLREMIRTIYHAYPGEVKAALLLGHLAVPYSGSLTPDGHFGDHTGAWPADIYYGDMDGAWTDKLVNVTTATRSENHNQPWDGKFDTSRITNGVELAIGRIDFANLPAFSDSEQTLLANYLDKNHAYRHRQFALDAKGFLHDGLSWLSEAPASGAYRAASACFGASSLDTGNWNATLDSGTNRYAIAWGLSTGSYTTLNGITSAAEMPTRDYRAGFGFFLGSYSGDWDSTNNLLRAALASGTHTVATAWSGRPMWNLHELAMGDTLGDVLLSTQNQASATQIYAGFSSRYVHVALMGDPTVRLHPITPPMALAASAAPVSNAASLTWQAAATGAHYHVYRADSFDDSFVRLTPTPIAATTYTDSTSPVKAIYMVRAIEEQISGGGNYTNASQGVFVEWGLGAASQPTQVRVALSDTEVYERGTRQTTTVTLTREGGDTSAPLALNYVIGGVAEGTDVTVTPSGPTSIPAGAASVEITITALANEPLQEDRAAVFLLLPSSSYHVQGSAMVSATLQDAPADQWRKQRFTFSELNDPNISSMLADPDEDLLTNLLEYVLGSDPHAYSNVDLSVAPATAEEVCDAVTYVCDPNASDVQVELESCGNAMNWGSAVPVEIMRDLREDGLEEVTLTYPCAPERRFFRLTIHALQ